MGKRKERRLAAKTNAGRRVKLDLFAEPPGDLGGAAEHDELEGDTNSKGGAGLPNSPSSSGQKPQNPLLLLGQYSDESDDDSNQVLSAAAVENSSPENNDEGKSLLGESCPNLDTIAGEELTSQRVKQKGGDTNSASQECDQNMEDSDKRENDEMASSDLRTELDLREQVSVPETSSVEIVGDVGSGWKIVMHEESNNYYYWNTETGETSWEVPSVLAQETKLTCDQEAPSFDGKTDNVPVGTQESDSTSGVKLDGFSNSETIQGDANMVPCVTESYGTGSQMEEWNLVYNDGATHNIMTNEDHESAIDFSSRLVKHCEVLLERLESLKGSKDQLEGLTWISNYTSEVEIRLFDIKSLLSYGSSLLPFWMHSERQLKRLDSVISDEMSKTVRSGQLNEVEAIRPSLFHGENNFQESMGCKAEAEQVGTLDDHFHVTPSVDTAAVVSTDQDVKSSNVNAEHVSAFGSPTRHMESGSSEQVKGVVVPDATKNEFCPGEEVDMDVDMEVEDSNSAGNTAVAYALHAKEFAPAEQPSHPSPPSVYTSLVSEDMFTVPPPPDEEWIPPPPPDNEQVPPPPPDEPPPEPPYPPQPYYPETGQPPYAEQFNFSYPSSSFEYYRPTVGEAPNTNFYGHPEGFQVAMPHAPLYYGAVPSTYTETAQVAANPVESITYYGVLDGTAPAAPVVSSVESLQFHTESAPLSYANLASDHTGSINSFSGGSSSGSLINVNIERSTSETDGGSIEVPSTTATIQAPATISVKNTVSVSSTNSVPTVASIPVTSVVTKVQSKVPRTKKRSIAVASSLRSNKKVSSLVDKWKAAKEELLEDEEEPENAYELLERKRQRGIEEWYAQQITSGEAKDNANFQPLGGDWREKVKRRKARLAREGAQNAPAPGSEAPTDGNQQPDLTEFSRDLPSGWQAYWDESSRKVYYGNTVTSETTWTKPTK